MVDWFQRDIEHRWSCKSCKPSVHTVKLTLPAIKQSCLQEGQGASIKHHTQLLDFAKLKAKSELKAMELC